MKVKWVTTDAKTNKARYHQASLRSKLKTEPTHRSLRPKHTHHTELPASHNHQPPVRDDHTTTPRSMPPDSDRSEGKRLTEPPESSSQTGKEPPLYAEKLPDLTLCCKHLTGDGEENESRKAAGAREERRGNTPSSDPQQHQKSLIELPLMRFVRRRTTSERQKKREDTTFGGPKPMLPEPPRFGPKQSGFFEKYV